MSHFTISAVFAFWLIVAELTSAQVMLADTHIDLVPGYATGTGWDLHIGADDLGLEYATSGAPGATDWAIITLLSHNIAPRPSGSQFNFIGVPAGSAIYRVVDSPSPFGLNLGIGAEDNTIGTFASYFESDPRVQASGEWIRFRLKAFSGPGEMSLWASDISGPLVFMATANGIDASDSVYVLNGNHGDFNWAFTATGDYSVTLEASAFFGPGATNPTLSGDVTYQFTTVPEPSSLALIGTTLVPLAFWKRVRRQLKTMVPFNINT